MMLRRRIEKLEKTRPLATGDLIDRWDAVAMASLSREEQALLQDTAFRKRADPAAYEAAVQHWQDALSAGIANVSDDELNRMILILNPDSGSVEARP